MNTAPEIDVNNRLEARFKGGLELDFFPRQSLEPIKNKTDLLSIAKHAISVLMMGWPEKGTWGNLLSLRTLRAVLFRRDPDLLRNARLAFQEGFEHLHTQLKDKEFTALQHEQISLYLSNCLSILPFMDINPYESVSIPQYINHQWVMVEYKVTPIELTPTEGIDRLFLQDNDRVFAYGLEPINHDKATPHLIFMGTTYPAGQGLMSQLRADLNGFRTPGDILYQRSRQRISEWIDTQEHKPHVCGVSLGGSLSLLAAIDQGDKLSRVDALNPAGLHDNIFHLSHDHWDSIRQKPQVTIQKQADDPVSRFGYWKKEWLIYQVNPPKAKKGPNGLADHALNYAGFAETEFISVSPDEDNRQRLLRDRLIYTFLRGFLYYSIIMPYHYLIQPFFKFARAHPIMSLLLFVTAVSIPFAPMIAVVVLCSLSTIAVSYYGIKAMQNLVYKLNHAPDSVPAHRPELERNQPLDLYSNQMKALFSKADVQAYQSLLEHSNRPDDYSIQEENETSCIIEATKAKIHDMKRSIYLIREWSKHNKPAQEIKAVVEKQHQEYLKGLRHSL